MSLNFISVNKGNLSRYLQVGIQSYKEHYLHLWENSDPTPFIEAFLTQQSVKDALKDSHQLFYIIQCNQEDVGILNLTINNEKGDFLSKNNLLLNKIYLLKSNSSLGIGTRTLDFVHNLAKNKQKDVVWLYTMKKGNPLSFYRKHGYKIIKEAFIELPKVLEVEKEMWLMAKNI